MLQIPPKIIRRPHSVAPALADAVHPVLQRVYAARGITTIADLDKELKSLLPYHTLLNIDLAAHTLATAIEQQQKLLVIGDFDVDGATSTALAILVGRAFGANIAYLIPNRFKYGYGLSTSIVEAAIGMRPDWIITVDNGIANHAGVLAAKAAGINVLITDHHLPMATLPAADIIVNPNQLHDVFPSKNLAGVGVIFYVLLAVRAVLIERGWFVQRQLTIPKMSEYLDLVALGTVADLVPLDKNNKILVSYGLKLIQGRRCRQGILSLLSFGNRAVQHVTSTDLGFIAAPRLNAAGRLDDMSYGVECLLATDKFTADHYADTLHALNQERRLLEAAMLIEAEQQVSSVLGDNFVNLPYGIVLMHADWHQGVIGILAARIKERYHRPTIIFAVVADDILKGSARSIVGIHMRSVLDLVAHKDPDLMLSYGGHAMAAGVSITRANYATFVTMFNAAVAELGAAQCFIATLETDGALLPHDFTIDVARLLQQAGPWGQGFPEPTFDGTFVIIEQKLLQEKHLKLLVRPVHGAQTLEAICFNVDPRQWPNLSVKQISLVYKLDINYFRNEFKIQLLIEHISIDSNVASTLC